MTKNATRILIYAVIFLAVLNIVTFSTIGYHIYKSKSENETNGETIEGNTAGYTGRYFRDKLGLTQSQMNYFREVNNHFRTNARRINMELISQRRKMLDEMKNDNPDPSKLNSHSDSIGKLHADLKKYTYQYYNGIKELCDKKQRVQLEEIFEEFFINDFHMGNRGNMRGRWRHGQRQQMNN